VAQIQIGVARLAAVVVTPTAALRGVRDRTRQALARGATDEASVFDREVFARLTFFGWLLLGLGSLFLMILAAAVGDAVGGSRGRQVGLAFAAAIAAACVVGVLLVLPSVLRARLSAGLARRSRSDPVRTLARGGRPKEWYIAVQVLVGLVVLLGLLATA
jgi:hypothetical protein